MRQGVLSPHLVCANRTRMGMPQLDGTALPLLGCLLNPTWLHRPPMACLSLQPGATAVPQWIENRDGARAVGAVVLFSQPGQQGKAAARTFQARMLRDVSSLWDKRLFGAVHLEAVSSPYLVRQRCRTCAALLHLTLATHERCLHAAWWQTARGGPRENAQHVNSTSRQRLLHVPTTCHG